MKLVRSMLHAVVGLFIGDGALAMSLIGWVIAFTIALPSFAAERTWGALALVAGCCTIFVVNVVRDAHRVGRPRAEVIFLSAERAWRRNGFDFVDDEQTPGSAR